MISHTAVQYASVWREEGGVESRVLEGAFSRNAHRRCELAPVKHDWLPKSAFSPKPATETAAAAAAALLAH